jgi:hypothetical protein
MEAAEVFSDIKVGLVILSLVTLRLIFKAVTYS